MKRVVVAGCGFLGGEVARLMAAEGWSVTGVVHSPESVGALEGEPFEVRACDISEPGDVARCLGDLAGVESVVQCASSGRGGADQYRRVYRDGARNLLETLRPRRFVFTGSTSVYAQTDGSEVTEESPAEPDRETGKVLLETEGLVLASGGAVARVAGLYGPGRSVLLRKFLDGSAVVEGGGDREVNQVHRDDAASALALLAHPEVPGGIYNVSDDEPLAQLEIYRWLAANFERPLPPFGSADLDRKRGWTRKRVSNAKLRAAGWCPRYPSFRIAVLRDPRLLGQRSIPSSRRPGN